MAEPGWYRLTGQGVWQAVSDEQAEAEIAAGGGWDLVHVQAAETGEIPLF
jgi:hypothetical protein